MYTQTGRRLIWGLVALVAVGSLAFAEQSVYKWVDDEGVVHFGEAPPPGARPGSVEKMTMQSAAQAAGPAAAVPAGKSPQAGRARPQSAPDEAKKPDITAMTLDELDRRCDEAREKKIAPLRQAEIEKCQADKRNDPAWCERFNADFGDAGRTVSGTMRPRMFDDLPECVDALNERNRRGR